MHTLRWLVASGGVAARACVTSSSSLQLETTFGLHHLLNSSRINLNNQLLMQLGGGGAIGSRRYISTSDGSGDIKSKSKAASNSTKKNKKKKDAISTAADSEPEVFLDKRGSDFENYVRELPSYLAEDPDIGEMIRID